MTPITQKYGIDFPEMIDRIVDAVNETINCTKKLNDSEVRSVIMDLGMAKGDKAIINLYGFVRFAQLEYTNDQAQKRRMLTQVLGHDLQGRKNLLETPRSSSYEQYASK